MLNVLRQLQQMLLPTNFELSQINDLEIAGFMEPADEVDGDYSYPNFFGRATVFYCLFRKKTDVQARILRVLLIPSQFFIGFFLLRGFDTL